MSNLLIVDKFNENSNIIENEADIESNGKEKQLKHNQYMSKSNRNNNNSNGNIVFKINELTNPTIDEVLNQVPLIYDPITKQLLLQRKFNQHQQKVETIISVNNFNGTNLTEIKPITVLSSTSTAETVITKEITQATNVSANDKQSDINTVNELNTQKYDELEKNLINTDDSLPLSSLSSLNCETQSLTTENLLNDEEKLKPKKSLNSSSSPSSSSSLSSSSSSSLLASTASSFASLSLTASVVNVINRLKKKNSLNEKNQLEPRSSTTALILENRPSNLPAKSIDEQTRHRNEYEEMVKEAKRKELKDAKVTKKLENKRKKEEDKMSELIKIWNQELLPNWNKLRKTKKLDELWWRGIPPSVRGKVWKLAIGNELNLTNELFEICVKRSKEKHWIQQTIENELITDIIKLDVNRTFVHLGLFQANGPYHEHLIQLLEAYVCYRPDISYVQGMCFLAAMFLLNMECMDAFICLSNLLNSHLLITFYRVEQRLMKIYYNVFQLFFEENFPDLYKHFNEEKLTPDLYLMDWIYSLFSRSLPLDVSTHVWDLIIRDGDEFIIRASLAILFLYKDILIGLDFIHLAQFLTKLPDDITSEKLFPSISSIRMTVGIEKLTFTQVLNCCLNEQK